MTYFDIVVIGGGHAGIEASVASATMGCSVALITMDRHTIGRLSCNPSIGGSAKGHLVKEIDALGGVMGRIADQTGLQFKMLNKSKGPAIWSPRSQNDKDLYPRFAQALLNSTNNLTQIDGAVTEILERNGKVYKVRLKDSTEIGCSCVILCSGTFLNAILHTGEKSTSGGRIAEDSATHISDMLESFGLERGRLKTGTPPRVDIESIDFSRLALHAGDSLPLPFSQSTKTVSNKILCFSTQTNEKTHDILREGFDRSPMFTGRIQGSGPRYCPSVEDKINRFADKTSHLIVLEPEGLYTNSVYVNGFSTSLPIDIQERSLHSIAGLEQTHIQRPGYAVEYDFFFPYQLQFTLETKAISGLFFAGQINGTSGYEEAAAQGLIAGINAARKIQEKSALILQRSEAYIGVLIDDLVNKNTEEPYRIFTSLAEYRLLLRQDNADRRLSHYGFEVGLVPETVHEQVQHKYSIIQSFIDYALSTRLAPEIVNPYLLGIGETSVIENTTLEQIARRSTTHFKDIISLDQSVSSFDVEDSTYENILEHVNIEIKYKGYIDRQMKDIEKFRQNELKAIPYNIDYYQIQSLSKESRDKLSKIRPQSLGQASRIAGVSASDIAILTIYIK